MTKDLSHFDDLGNARMVDVGNKPVTRRTATAAGTVVISRSTANVIADGSARKGDVLGTARLAGIMACKQTPSLIPLCHIIPIDTVEIQFEMLVTDDRHAHLQIQALVKSTGTTGVEMEALTAVTTAALTVYDMCKSMDREMEIQNVRLVSKTGGSSGDFVRSSDNEGT